MQLQDFVDIGSSGDAKTLKRRLINFAGELDFGIVNAIAVVDRPGEHQRWASLGNIPAAYQSAYRDAHNSKRDPVLTRLKRSSRPVTYDQSTYLADDVIDLWEEQAAFGYRTGVSIALHMPNFQHFILGVDREAPLPSDPAEQVLLFSRLQLLAVYCQEAVFRVLVPTSDAKPEAARLTTRELEVLKWAAQGKSTHDVSDILAISYHTAVFHLRNCMAKLGVSSKQQAIVKALNQGLL